MVRVRDSQKEQLIRENALRIFFKDGFEGFSMQKLARASRVSPATLYIYFKDKEDLIFTIYREEMTRMQEYALRGFDAEMSFADGLKVQWRNRARYYLDHPRQSHFLEQIRYTPLHEKAAKLADSAFASAMKAFLHNAEKRGEIVRLPLEVFWALAYAPLYQLLKFHIHGRSFPGTERFRINEEIMNGAVQRVIKALTP